MRSPTPARRPVAGTLPAVILAVVLAGSFGLAGCSGDGGDSGGKGSGNHGSDAGSVKTKTTVAKISGRLGDAKRRKARDEVTAVVDGFFDHAYLGAFPRTAYAKAFADFTANARKDALKQLDVMTSHSFAQQIDQATAIRRRVRLDLFAPDGHARGVTAHFALDFTTSGTTKGDHEVRGDLYLSKSKGGWQVFGFRVDQPVDIKAAS